MRNHFGHVFSFMQKDCRISDPAAALKEGIYIVNVFKTKGRDRQNALPVKYEKVYFVPGLLSCYALQDTGKMCRNIVFDVKKL